MGRPKKPIDPKMVQDLAAIGCKNNEIATLLDVSANTIERRFAPQLRKGRENLKMSLRRWQLEAAKKGNVSMLIWLGKQYLAQTEKVEEKITQEVKQEIIYATEWASKLPDETNS